MEHVKEILVKQLELLSNLSHSEDTDVDEVCDMTKQMVEIADKLIGINYGAEFVDAIRQAHETKND